MILTIFRLTDGLHDTSWAWIKVASVPRGAANEAPGRRRMIAPVPLRVIPWRPVASGVTARLVLAQLMSGLLDLGGVPCSGYPEGQPKVRSRFDV
jgi:hypothetical protein